MRPPHRHPSKNLTAVNSSQFVLATIVRLLNIIIVLYKRTYKYNGIICVSILIISS